MSRLRLLAIACCALASFAHDRSYAATPEELLCSRPVIPQDSYLISEKWTKKYADLRSLEWQSLVNEAESGSVTAQAVVAMRALEGKHDGSAEEGLRYLAQARSQNEPFALYISGTLEQLGRYVDRNLALAHEHFQLSADLGFVPAKQSIAADYLLGSGTRQDYEKARTSAEAAVEDGYVSANQILGVIYNKGLGVPQDTQKGFLYAKEAADAGDPAGQFDVARQLLLGEGLPADSKGAYRYATSAYCNGLKLAGLIIGKIELSRSTPQSVGLAADLFAELADQGNPDAALTLSDLYLFKKYGMFNLDRAFHYLSLASNAGLPGARYRYGAALLRYGRNKEEHELGEQKLTEAANAGDANAQYDLGVAYSKGTELSLDANAAKLWFERAAEAGNADAKAALQDWPMSKKD